jgi:hypothetical protein
MAHLYGASWLQHNPRRRARTGQWKPPAERSRARLPSRRRRGVTDTFEALDEQAQAATQHITNSTFSMIRVAANSTCVQVRAMSFP